VTEWNWKPLGLDDAARVLEGFPARWWIAGGWALDLHLGRTTRGHEDVDVAVLRGDQLALRSQLAGWDIRIAHEGRLEPWTDGRRLELPRHGLWARRNPDGPWELELLLQEHDDTVWRYRRDPTIAVPIAQLGLSTKAGLPYLRPEIVLLFKSRAPRERDEADLDAVLPKLDPAARARLRGWLAPGHAWLNRI
jgi:Aminoglycoside-2''-adenylyltransferase